MKHIAVLIALFSFVFMNCGGSSTDPENTVEEFQLKGSISGFVTDTNLVALSNVSITVEPGGMTSVTDTLGYYTIPNIPEGTYTLNFAKENYLDQSFGNINLLMDQDMIFDSVTLVFSLDTNIQNVIDTLVQSLRKRDFTGQITVDASSVALLTLKVMDLDTALLYIDTLEFDSKGFFSTSIGVDSLGGFLELNASGNQDNLLYREQLAYDSSSDEIQIAITAFPFLPSLSAQSYQVAMVGKAIEIPVVYSNLGDYQAGENKFYLNQEEISDLKVFEAFTSSKLGLQDFELVVEDADGNQAKAVFQVEVIDAPKMISVPAGQFEKTTGKLSSETVVVENSYSIAEKELSNDLYNMFLTENFAYGQVQLNRQQVEFTLFDLAETTVYSNHSIAVLNENHWDSLGTRVVSAYKEYPAQFISFYGAILFCDWLNAKAGYPAKFVASSGKSFYEEFKAGNFDTDFVLVEGQNGFRLAFEKEWMWAAMGAKQATNLYGTPTDSLELYANFNTAQLQSSGSFLSNDLGIYDMVGSVWEWTLDAPGSFESPDNSAFGMRLDKRLLLGGSYFSTLGESHLQLFNYLDPVSADESSLDANYPSSNKWNTTIPSGIRLVLGK